MKADWTVLAAWYGAVLSTVVLGLSMWQRRQHLRIVISPDSRARQDVHPAEPGRPRALATVSNVGAVPVTLERVFLSDRRKGGQPVLLTDRYDAGSLTIAPGASEVVHVPLLDVAEHGLTWLVVESQTGRRWRCRLSLDALRGTQRGS